MRIAIVGAGVSGLVVGHLLHPAHEVTVFEARDRVGGHVNTVRSEDRNGQWAVDTGFIVYNETNYPLFARLLKKLRVPTQTSDMSFSVRCDRTGLEYNGTTIRTLFAQKRNLFKPSYYRMIRDILRFNREAVAAVENGAGGLSLEEYLEEGRFSQRLADHYLVPMGSALWSMPRRAVLEMPAEFFVRFFENHGMLSVNERPEWRVVCEGSDRYLDPLIAPFRDRIRTSTPVTSIRRENDSVLVDGERFDHVVLACHADQSLGMLEDPTLQEHEVLSALPFQDNRVVLHTDSTVLPTRKAAWGAWNYHITGEEEAAATVTYNMNMLQSLSAEKTFCVTLNPASPIDPASVLYETHFSHPVYTSDGARAQGRWAEISGVARTHYCGAYWGFGFHEDGVRSAVGVGAAFGAEL